MRGVSIIEQFDIDPKILDLKKEQTIKKVEHVRSYIEKNGIGCQIKKGTVG